MRVGKKKKTALIKSTVAVYTIPVLSLCLIYEAIKTHISRQRQAASNQNLGGTCTRIFFFFFLITKTSEFLPNIPRTARPSFSIEWFGLGHLFLLKWEKTTCLFFLLFRCRSILSVSSVKVNVCILPRSGVGPVVSLR